MKFICLGYFDESKFNALSQSEQAAAIERCFAYDDELDRKGHWLGGEALQTSNRATLRSQNGKVTVTDGPYVETKEVIGGILILKAKDLQEAIDLMSKHPGLQMGPFEIRAVDEEFTATIDARHQTSTA